MSDGPNFDKHELIPVIAQDATTGDVLMLAYMNRESYDETLATGCKIVQAAPAVRYTTTSYSHVAAAPAVTYAAAPVCAPVKYEYATPALYYLAQLIPHSYGHYVPPALPYVPPAAEG